MQHPIPNHLETEDTVFLSLSMRQCGILFLGVVLGSLAFNDCLDLPNPGLALGSGVIAASLIGLVTLAVAFVRVLGRPLDEWAIIVGLYGLHPHRYAWRFDPALLGDAGGEPPDGALIEEEEAEAW